MDKKKIIGVLIAIAIVGVLLLTIITGKAFFIPASSKEAQAPDTENFVTGKQGWLAKGEDPIATLAAIERFFNSRNDGYTVKLAIEKNPLNNTTTTVILVVANRKIFTWDDPERATPLEARKFFTAKKIAEEKMMEVLAETLFTANRITEPSSLRLIYIDMMGENPSGGMLVYIVNKQNTLILRSLTPEQLKDITPNIEWTKYTVRRFGEIFVSDKGPVGLTPEKDIIPIPDK